MNTKSQRQHQNPHDYYQAPSLWQQLAGLLPVIAVPISLMLLWGALHISVALGLAFAGVLIAAGGVVALRISSGF